MDKNDNAELEFILEALKKRQEERAEAPEESAPLPAPEKIEFEHVAPLEPPKPTLTEQKTDEPEFELFSSVQKPERQRKERQGKEKKPRKSPSFSPKQMKENAKKRLAPKIKKDILKPLAILIGMILLIFALIFGGYQIYQSSKTAYLKPYIQKYQIEFPEEILEELCDAYGSNQQLAGEISIADTATKQYVSSKSEEGYAKLQTGSSVYEPQQFRAVALTKSAADLESIYATPEGFLNATQSLTFNTLFEESSYRVVAAYYTNDKLEDDKGYRFPYDLYGNLTEKSFKDYQDKIESRRLYNTGYKFHYDDSFLTVSVESDFMENFRFVLLCVKDKKSIKKSSMAEVNEKIHYPQVYYDKNEAHNPYRFAGKWYPEIYTNAERTATEKLTIADFE